MTPMNACGNHMVSHSGVTHLPSVVFCEAYESVDGAPVGAINRVPQPGETRSNMHVGGRAEKVELTARDREICDAIGPRLKEYGQIFVGIDVIGDYLTEINVTSPTGLQELERFDGTNAAGLIWDAIEGKRAGK